jgi:DNA-binding NarL/FixJ family response regulator
VEDAADEDTGTVHVFVRPRRLRPGRVLREARRAAARRPGARPLTDARARRAAAAHRGRAYKEIAEELFISVRRVETHVSSGLRKTQVSNRYELSHWASDRRLG